MLKDRNRPDNKVWGLTMFSGVARILIKGCLTRFQPMFPGGGGGGGGNNRIETAATLNRLIS